MDRRLKLALEILKNAVKLRSNELVRRLMKKGPMARQTAINIIKEGERKRKIFREDTMIGNQEAVFYTVFPDIDKNEKLMMEQMEKLLKGFDEGFSAFEDKFSSLSIEDKSEGVEGIVLFLTHFSQTAGKLWIAHQKKREWKTLLNEANSRKASLEKLVKLRPKKEQSIISRHVLEGSLLYLDEAKSFLDKYVH